MAEREDDFLRTLRETFKVEAAEHLQTIARGLLELEKAPPPDAQREHTAAMFRAAHSLKGAARAVDETAIETACQALEDLFAGWKHQPPDRGACDRAHQMLDAITAIVAPAGGPSQRSLLAQTVPTDAEPSSVERDQKATKAARTVSEKIGIAETTVRVPVSKLDSRLVDAEEMLVVKLTLARRLHELRDIMNALDSWRREWTLVEPETRVLRRLAEAEVDLPSSNADSTPRVRRLLDFVEWNEERVRHLDAAARRLIQKTEQDRHVIGKLVDDLLEDSKKLLLLPFGLFTASFPKLVRDLAREQHKEVDLILRGEDVEIDKRVLEEMKDPLVHLLRNAVDHGVELPERRREAGKPSRATVTLSVSRVDSSKVELMLADDGAGIDTARVKQSAIEQGLLSAKAAEELNDAAAQAFIFQPDVTTSRTVTKLSGRGLGMAIVREKVDKLGGVVATESRVGKGTTFRIVLPTMLATFRGILVTVAQRRFVVPTLQTERVVRVARSEIKTVEGRETIVFDGATVALVQLADVLGLATESPSETSSHVSVLVLGPADQRIAFVVDAVLAEQEVLVKPLRKPLVRVRNISGATVLGSGQVVPILDVMDLLKSARKTGGAVLAPVMAPQERVAPSRSILVAEDSITSRTLIKGILESAGYQVKTAVDGLEAFGMLRTGQFDLLVSDVEMPRLNGFDLTARIRGDRKLADLPVVLVTALETPADRERGIDAGANSYLVKSGFDEGNLLATIRRLIGA